MTLEGYWPKRALVCAHFKTRNSNLAAGPIHQMVAASWLVLHLGRKLLSGDGKGTMSHSLNGFSLKAALSPPRCLKGEQLDFAAY